MKIKVGLAAAVGSILIPWAAAQVPPRAQTRPRPPQQKLVQPAPAAAQPGSVAPPPPEQRPATPPQVAFNGGVLTITADNSTLGDILRAVHHQTGAMVDVPGNATERVVGRFGPGPARDVVASLLNGSHFNYVLVGSESDPSGLDRVVLISKPASDEAPVEQARFSGRALQAAPQPADNADANDDDAQDMIPDASEATDEQANQAQGEDPAQAQQPGQQPGIKTPEQLLQELQQRQQQMQQQGAPVPPGYPQNPNGATPPQQK